MNANESFCTNNVSVPESETVNHVTMTKYGVHNFDIMNEGSVSYVLG